MELDLIFIILIIVLAVAVLIAVSSLRKWLFPIATLVIGGGSSDPVCSETDTFIDTFINGRFTSDLASKMENLVSDIAYDVGDINEKKIKTMKESALNTITAKLMLDSMLHWYIYDKSPNEISRDAITENIKKIELVAKEDICFTPQRISAVINLLREGLKDGKSREEKVVQASPRECFRKVQVLLHTNDSTSRKKLADEVDQLKEELSKKNIELRQRGEELDREKLRSSGLRPNGFTSSLSTDLLLDECNRERRMLQEKIYELRKDIDRVRVSPTSDGEVRALRDRIEDLRNRNTQLESQLRDTERNQSGEMNNIVHLTTELNNCRKLLDEVLSSQSG